MAIVTIGIDLAKNVFAVHGVGACGKPELVKPEVRRAKLLQLIGGLPPCLIGMEACSGAHHWAREFQKLGHTVRIMAPKFVTPYRMSGKHGKNDAADAAAICEAVTRPNMRFVPIKTLEQQSQLFIHRAQQRVCWCPNGSDQPHSWSALRVEDRPAAGPEGVQARGPSGAKTCLGHAIGSSVTCSVN